MVHLRLSRFLIPLLKCCPVFLATAFLCSACDDDFSPNAEWRDIPSVFCLLDQDDDTIFVRLQRCYLGSDNLFSYSAIKDSVYYPDGTVEVVMRAWNSESDMLSGSVSPVRELSFDCMLHDKVDGDFVSGPQPLFYHPVVSGDMDTAYLYQLIVRRSATGEVIASSNTRLVGDADSRYGWLKSPSRVGSNGRVTFNMLTGVCTISWYPLSRGRLYQPYVMFYYRYRFSPDSLRSVDVACDAVLQSNVNSIELNTSLYKEHYLGELSRMLVADTNHKLFVDTVGIILKVANEHLNAYISSTSSTGGQDFQVYNNIEGGVGLFASRRSHLMEKVLADKGDQPTGMHTLLEQLRVGFQQDDL